MIIRPTDPPLFAVNVCISLLLIVAPCLGFHLNSTACVEIVLVYIFVIVSVTLRIHFGSLAHGVVVFCFFSTRWEKEMYSNALVCLLFQH